MMRFLLLALLVSSATALAAPEGANVGNGASNTSAGGGQVDSPQEAHPAPKTFAEFDSSAIQRSHSHVNISIVYSPLGLYVPQKRGVMLNAVFKHFLVGAEYLYADLGLKVGDYSFAELEETHALATLRWFPSSTFHVTSGYGLRRYQARLGPDELNAKVAASNQIALLGVGNHWQIKPGLTFGADWIDIYATTRAGSLDAPAANYVANANDRKNTLKALKILRYAPSVALLRADIGFSF
jgi:hypothetical protein